MAVRKCFWISNVGQLHPVWACADTEEYVNPQYVLCSTFSVSLLQIFIYQMYFIYGDVSEVGAELALSGNSVPDCYTFMHSRICVTVSYMVYEYIVYTLV